MPITATATCFIACRCDWGKDGCSGCWDATARGIDLHERRGRLAAAAARRHHGVRHTSRRPRTRSDCGTGRCAGATGPPHLPQPVRARKPCGGGAQAARQRECGVDDRPRLRNVSAPERAAGAVCWPPFGRRAADVGNCPRADGQSARAPDGRAVGGPGAADCRRGDGDNPAVEAARVVDRSRRTECQARARCCRRCRGAQQRSGGCGRRRRSVAGRRRRSASAFGYLLSLL